MNESIQIGSILVKRRKFLKITQEHLADIAGVSLRSLKSIENGDGNPTVKQISKILKVLGMKITIEIQ